MTLSQPISTIEDFDKTFIGLLREWIELTANVLLETAGLDGSIKVLTPYCKNEGEAGALALRKATGFDTSDIDSLLIFWVGLCHHACMGGNCSIWSNSKDTAEAVVNNCVFEGRNKVICFAFCESVAHEGLRALNANFVNELIESRSWGNNCCRWRNSSVVMGRSSAPLLEIDIPPIPKNIMNFVALASLGENWVILTKALLDYCGNKKAMELVLPRIRSSGTQFGEKLTNEHGETNELTEPNVLMEQVNNVLHRKFNIEDQVIGECPFSGSPPEICLQCESFVKGIFESMMPGYAVSFDRMMGKGDASCHWVINNRSTATRDQMDEDSAEDEMLKKLKWRLTNGEITIEQYRELKEVLLER